MNEIHRINPPSSVLLSEKRYPVITNDPSLSDIFGNLRSEEYKLLLGSQLVGAPWGYYIGSKVYASRQGAIVGMLVFGAAAIVRVSQHSAGRLIGVLENGIEYKNLVERPGV